MRLNKVKDNYEFFVLSFLFIVIIPLLLTWLHLYNKKNIQKTLDRGFIISLDECLWLFPNACEKCGFRKFDVNTSWREWFPGDISGALAESYETRAYCLRCGTLKNGAPPYFFEDLPIISSGATSVDKKGVKVVDSPRGNRSIFQQINSLPEYQSQ